MLFNDMGTSIDDACFIEKINGLQFTSIEELKKVFYPSKLNSKWQITIQFFLAITFQIIIKALVNTVKKIK